MGLFESAPSPPETTAPRQEDLEQVGLALAEAFTRPEDEVWASFNSQVADLVAKLDVPSFKA